MTKRCDAALGAALLGVLAYGTHAHAQDADKATHRHYEHS